MLTDRTKNTVIDTRRLIGWAAKQKEISPKHIIIIGFSRGVIAAGLVTMTDPKITGAIFVMGGANPAETLYHCKYAIPIRQAVTQRFHWSNKKYWSVLHRYLSPLDVSDYPTRLNPSHVLIFDSQYDKCIPKVSRDNLWLSMGKPTRISFLYTHRISFLSMTMIGGYYLRRKVFDFINEM